VHRHAHDIEAHLLDEAHVVARDVGVAEALPEGGRTLAAEQAFEGAVDLARRRGALELEHVALGHQPVAEVDALDVQSRAAGLDEAPALGADQPVLGNSRHRQGEQYREQPQPAHDATLADG
jgi:hypothetical protein